MNDFDIPSGVEGSLRIAESITNYTILVTLAGVSLFLFIVLVVYYLFDIRERRKQTEEQGKNMAVISDFIKKMADTMKENAMRSVNLDMARGLVATELEKTKALIIIQIGTIKQKNHLDDREAVESKVHLFIEQYYYKNYEGLRKFEFQGKQLSTFLEEKWKNVILEQVLRDCEKNAIDFIRLEETYGALFTKFKNEMNRRIDDANNCYGCD